MPHTHQLLPCILNVIPVAPAREPTKAATYQITHVYSNGGFSITNFFFKEEGGFRQYSRKLFYDPDHPQRSRVEMVVQAESIDTRDEGRDRALRSDAFFDVARYSTLNLSASQLSQNGMECWMSPGILQFMA